MTVAELMALLAALPPDARVAIECPGDTSSLLPEYRSPDVLTLRALDRSLDPREDDPTPVVVIDTSYFY